MHPLADVMAKLVQILCCVKIDTCMICNTVDVIVDLLVHSSGPFGGPFFVWGGGGGGFFRTQRTPPGYGLSVSMIFNPSFTDNQKYTINASVQGRLYFYLDETWGYASAEQDCAKKIAMAKFSST